MGKHFSTEIYLQYFFFVGCCQARGDVKICTEHEYLCFTYLHFTAALFYILSIAMIPDNKHTVGDFKIFVLFFLESQST